MTKPREDADGTNAGRGGWGLLSHGRSAALHLGTFHNYNWRRTASCLLGHIETLGTLFVIRRDDSSIYQIPSRQDRAHTSPLKTYVALYTVYNCRVRSVVQSGGDRQARTCLQLHRVTSRSSLCSPRAVTLSTLLRNRQGVPGPVRAKRYGVRNVGEWNDRGSCSVATLGLW